VTQPPVSGRGAGGQPGRGGGLPGRDPRLAAFAQGNAGDRCPPGPWTGMVLNELSGPDRQCPSATDDELIGLLGRWAAQESWAMAARLGVIRELLRRRALPGAAVRRLPGGLPDAWQEGTEHEVAAELGISLPAADSLVQLAWTLQARIPRIGAALAAGVIDYVKARAIAAETAVLDDAHLAAAEELILAAGLAGKTPGQIGKLAARAVVTIDPDGARKRREQAEKEDARVRFWRERAGTSALAAYGLPTDAALRANANIGQRADEYKKAGLDGRMDQLRVLAYLDILNGTTAASRITQAQAEAAQAEAEADQAGTGGPDETPAGESAADAPGDTGDHHAGEDSTGDERSDEDEPGDGPEDNGPDGEGPGGSGPGNGGHPEPGPAAGPGLAARTNLTIPLPTLLHLADRPGDGYGLGPLDPALARQLAATAARNPRSEWCITVTDSHGYAIGHGCCKLTRKTRNTRQAKPPPVNGRNGPWAFTLQDDPGPPGGYGTWTLTLPGGERFTVKLELIPLTDCDHQHESHAYQPGDALRHLVQVRDGECTFPACSRHARESDFEHAIPYDKGGRTCACNAGARSRRCHKVKQSRGWNVTQPLPGWHQWTTPPGRSYTQGPMQYPS
jgi:hypothetical protein